jgi:predicted TIM-barrel fold metal-dependent hydrolase
VTIDSLVHVTSDGRWFQTNLDASTDTLMRQMDQAGVERAVVVPLAGYISNDFVISTCSRYPVRLIPGASFNPAVCPSPEQAVRHLREELKNRAYAVLKLHPRLHQYDPLDPRCLAVLAEISTWEDPPAIWMDTLLYFRGGVLRRPLVDSIHAIVSGHPALKFVLLHAGGSWVLQLAEAVRDCPNSFLDISFTLKRYYGSSLWADLRYLVQTFDRRLLFGSDFPEISIPDAVNLFKELTAGLNPDKAANVAGRNLEALLLGKL